MKFGLALRRNAIPEWRSQYLDYDALKRYLKCIPFSAEKMSDGKLLPQWCSLFWTLLLEAALTPTEVAFDEKIRLEVQKANSFYELKLEDIIRSKILLVDKLRSLVPNESLAPDTLQNIYTLTTKSTVSNIFNRRKKKEYYALRKSLLEFYRGLLLLKNFQKLNYTCLLKILKKHDKVWTACCLSLSFLTTCILGNGTPIKAIVFEGIWHGAYIFQPRVGHYNFWDWIYVQCRICWGRSSQGYGVP